MAGGLGPIKALIQGLVKVVVAIIALPLIILFLCLWLVATVTGIGPLVQYWCTKRDKALLNRYVEVGDHHTSRMVTRNYDANYSQGRCS